ncbi:MAG: DUF2127 domain-containing protein [Gemmatimonadetes bacterium]|nr:DUF2127 domain-containing protein [Gemmatimonadota bacterium]
MATRIGRLVHLAFDIGVIAKGIDGVLELIGGGLLLGIPPASFQNAIFRFTQHELSEDPNDFFATHARELVGHLTSNLAFVGALYLLLHGVVKVFLVYALLRHKQWAYPIAIVVFATFGVYQIYRYVLSPSFLLSALTVLDAIVILLTWAEYRRLREAAVAA